MVVIGRFLVVLALVGSSVAERRLRGNAQPRDEVRIFICSFWKCALLDKKLLKDLTHLISQLEMFQMISSKKVKVKGAHLTSGNMHFCCMSSRCRDYALCSSDIINCAL